MGWLATSTSEVQKQQQQVLQRKCKLFFQGLESCRKANHGGEVEAACKNLKMRVITCLGEHAAPAEADAHRRCYTSLYKTGLYKGKGHCMEYEEAMINALRKQKLYPV